MLVLSIVLAGLASLLWPEVPAWRIAGTRSTPASSVSFASGPLGCPRAGATIAVIGDSHVAGSRVDNGGGEPFGQVFAQALGGRVAISLHGVGGDTAAMGEQRWRGRDLPGTDLVILAFGTNDAAPRGWLREKQPVAIADYAAALSRQIARWRARGQTVILLAPPPGGSRAITARLQHYRRAARDVGRANALAVLDPADAFASCPASQPVLSRDAVHMNAAGHRCLGLWLARQFCPAVR
ncbi:SGNH/GDSL hydrolase family protein [Erythrobacter sp. R86502]|uniref:SGNH/GDSL hydrolase family protein n=1 Tax=Erythrobacter sp. R86502 TaxID=3093846 RepID=UPI0036D40886